MYNVTGLMERITTVTGYSVEVLAETKPSLVKIADLPKVFVGSVGVKQVDSFGSGRTDLDSQLYAEDLVQFIEVQFVCAAGDEATIWNTIGAAIAGWHEATQEDQFTGLMYVEGGLLGRENSRVWWADRWTIQFPRTF